MPKPYERKIRENKPDLWSVFEWRGCDCPDCDKDGHWMLIALVGEAEAKRMLNRED